MSGNASKALLMGVQHFAPTVPLDKESSPGKPGWEELPFVATLLPRLKKAYEGLEYEVIMEADPDEDTVVARINEAIRDEYSIVHLISHGATSPDGSPRSRAAADPERLYMIPSRGTTVGTNICDWVKSAHEHVHHPVLFVVDLCHAGVAANLSGLVQVPSGELHAWVIAATTAPKLAYDGRFSLVVAELLEKIADRKLFIRRSKRHIAWSTVVRRIYVEMTSPGKRRQEICTTPIDHSPGEPDLPFFPNPRWEEDSSWAAFEALPATVRAFVDAPETEHFIDRVGEFFVGRDRQLTELAPWLDDSDAGGLRVVTGAPGSGKSALLGALVCGGHSAIAEAAPELRGRLSQNPNGLPSRNEMFAAIHARGRELKEILLSLAVQWRLPRVIDAGDTQELVAAVRSLPEPPPLVFDALDEALDPVGLMNQLLLPLVEDLPDRVSSCRLLVGTRRQTRLRPLFDFASAQGPLLDLDQVPIAELRDDLQRYLSNRLDNLPSYADPAQRRIRDELAAAAAATLANEASPNRDWGQFLVAQIYSRALESLPVPNSPEAAAQRGATVPKTLPKVLALDLQQRHEGRKLRAVLAAAAWARGDGLPVEPIIAIAQDLDPTVSEDNIVGLLESARFYLRTAAEEDGFILFRLFHQGLAEHLKGDFLELGNPQ